MIIKIADFYYETELSPEAARSVVDSVLIDHVKEDDELDMEHLMDDIEENEEFESAPDANAADIEITMEELEDRTNNIIDDADDELGDDEDDGYEEALYSEDLEEEEY